MAFFERDETSPGEDDKDVQLMARLARGERAALADLVRRHQHRVFEIAYRVTGNRALSEDVTQDAFLRIWDSASAFQPRARFSTWLYRVVVNLCLDAFKRKKAAPPVQEDRVDDRQNAGIDILERDEAAQRIRAAVAALPERQRLALVLHRFSGLPLAEIVTATGWSPKAVESLLVRAYGALRCALSDLQEK